MNHYWQNWRASDFNKNLKSHIAILPLAATEQHGPHLPLATDTLIAKGLIKNVVKKLSPKDKIVFLPVQDIGLSLEHKNFAGTLTADWDSLGKVWLNIGADVFRTGIKKMIFITSHGGNMPLMEIVARQLRMQYNMKIAYTSWEKLMPTKPTDIHGGQFETSIMLALHPELVDKTKLQNFKSESEKLKKQNKLLAFHSSPAKIAWAAEDLNKQGVVGNAKAATSIAGKKYLNSMTNGFITLIKEFSKL